MPNARVGAMPQPSRPKEQQQQEMSSRGRGSRHKGISMEDLKQQTAMRLAQEQHHHRNGAPDGASVGGHEVDDGVQKPDPKNVIYNSQLAHFNHYNGVHQQAPLHYGYEMRDRVYSADGSCTSSLSYDNGFETNSTGIPVPPAAPLPTAAAAAASAAVLSPMGHASSSRMNQPVHSVHGRGASVSIEQQTKNSGKANALGTSKLNYPRGSPSVSQRQHSSQHIQLGGHGNRQNQHKPQKKKQQRQKVQSDANLYSQPGQQQYQVYSAMEMNDSSSANYAAPTFHPERQQRSKKGVHRPATNVHSHFYQQSGLSGHQEMQFGGKQSKLPHGLTVQELKEMTKARLAAEAAEKNDTQGGQGESQPDISSNQSVTTQASSSSEGDLFRRHENKQGQNYYPYIQNRQNSLESVSSAPASAVRAPYQAPGSMFKSQSHHGLSDFSNPGAQSQRQMRMSPEQNAYQNYNNHHTMPHQAPPPGFSNGQQGHLVPLHSHQNSQKHQQCEEWRRHMDTLETASITSINSGLGSEYLGSESAFGIVQPTSSASVNDDTGNMAFGRSRSYPAGGNISNALEQTAHENTPMSTVSTPGSLFDYSSGGGPNRRRTSTMSPPLSNLHEDRPLTATSLGADDYLAIPLFDSTPNSQLNARVHHVESSSSPNVSRGSSPAFPRFGGTNPSLGGGSVTDIFHCPSSVSTVPTVTPSGDNEDDHDDLPPLSFGQSDRAISGGGISMSEELPNSVAESVLGTPLIMEGRKVVTGGNADPQQSVGEGSDRNGVSAVFRNSPGLLGSESNAGRYHVPGREVSLSSTSSFFSDTNILGQSTEFGASRSRTHSWAGSTNAMTPIGISGGPSCPPSNLADDINNLLNFSDSVDPNPLSTPVKSDLDMNHNRPPSLVSRIDPELKVGSTILTSTLSSTSPIRGSNDLFFQNPDQQIPPPPPPPEYALNNKGPQIIPETESTALDNNVTPSSSQQSKRGSSTKKKNRRRGRKTKGDQRAGINP